jgi:tetratricopeptide (TPR) repeat protein
MRSLPLVLILLTFGVGAAAGGLPRAEALYRAGDMREAAAAARTLGSADAYALAAKASLVEAIYQAKDGERTSLLEQAISDAKEALELDPKSVDARLQVALALGHLAEDDVVGAQMNGYVEEGRRLIDQALELAPDDPWAHGLLGMWHLQVVRHAGRALAGSLYGADPQTGLAQCEKALAMAPRDLTIRFGCALSRLQADPDGVDWRALDQLKLVEHMPAQDAAESLVRAKAERVVREINEKRARD